MTLATVPRYDPDAVEEVGRHAVVVGAGIAGLCAGRVLADGFETVTIVDRDPLPDEPVARRGVPQSHHVHALLEAGRATLEDLFPGFGEDLLRAGGVLIDAASDVDFYLEGGFLADGPRRQPGYSATRPLYEQVIRRQLAESDGIELLANRQFIEYRHDDGNSTVTGVWLRSNGKDREELAADFVVDAMGRASPTPAWLRLHGYPQPATDEVSIDVAYSTTMLDRPPGVRRGIAVLPEPGEPRGGAAIPVEGDRWVMTLWGNHDATPPTDPEGFAAYAADIPVPHLKQLLEAHPWETENIAAYRFPSSLRRRYGDLERFPRGLAVLGDALASFNPVYGQGMSAAALEALVLHHTLATADRGQPAKRFYDRVEETVDVAWNLAVGSDHRFPETEGPEPRGADLFNWYLSRLLRRAHDDGELFDAFFRVQMMERPPASLLRPRVIRRVFSPFS